MRNLEAAPPARRGGHRVDAKILEARLAQRYEVFHLPRAVTTLLRQPSDEGGWSIAEQLQRSVLDLADGVEELRDLDQAQLAAVRAAVEEAADAAGRRRVLEEVEIQGVIIPAGA